MDTRLSDWCCSVSKVCDRIPLREGQYVSAEKSNSNTVTVSSNFQTYIYISNVKILTYD